MSQGIIQTSIVFAANVIVIGIPSEGSNLMYHNLSNTFAYPVIIIYLHVSKENFFMLPKDTDNSIDQMMLMQKKCLTPLSNAINWEPIMCALKKTFVERDIRV